jgi:hypothetical protein
VPVTLVSMECAHHAHLLVSVMELHALLILNVLQGLAKTQCVLYVLVMVLIAMIVIVHRTQIVQVTLALMECVLCVALTHLVLVMEILAIM